MKLLYLVIGLLTAAWVALVAVLLLTFHPIASDWSLWYDTALAARLAPHANLWVFSTTAWAGAHSGACSLWTNIPFLYPPLFAIVTEPLTLIPCGPATVLWRLLSLGLWGLCAALLARGHRRGEALAIVVFVLCYAPLIDGMLLGQVHLIILACCLAGAALVARGNDAWGGGVLAFGAWIKYVPGALVLYYLLTGRWRVALGAGLGGLLLLFLQLGIVGPSSLLAGILAAPHTSGAVSAWNFLPGGVLWALIAFPLFGLAILMARRAGYTNDALGIGWALCTLLLVSPVVHWLYLTWILPTFVACFDELLRMRRDRAFWLAAALLGLAVVLSLVPLNRPANADAIVLLWFLCGTQYLRGAGLLSVASQARFARSSQP